MKIKGRIGIGLALGLAIGLVWPLREAASWRPKRFCALSNTTLPAISPDGRYLLVWRNGAGVKSQIWEIETQRLVREVPNVSARFSPDSRHLWLWKSLYVPDAKRGRRIEHRLRVLEIESGRSVSFVDEAVRAGDSQHFDALWGLARSGREVWMTTFGTLRRFDARTGLLLEARDLGRGQGLPTGFASGNYSDVLSGDRILIVQGKTETIAELGRDGQLRRRAAKPWELDSGHNEVASSTYFVDVQAGRLVIFRARDGKPLWSIPAGQNFRGLSADGREVYVSDGRKGLSVRDAQTGRETRRLPGPKWNFVPSPDGKWLFEAREGAVWKWRAK